MDVTWWQIYDFHVVSEIADMATWRSLHGWRPSTLVCGFPHTLTILRLKIIFHTVYSAFYTDIAYGTIHHDS
eukprot:scaffold7001_cov93-Skeletonema_dohrnii-CCMP3373.AAC.2